MNISQPVVSSIRALDFGFLASEDIKALSVKQIRNAITFDNLLYPVPSGLYDPALGAWGENILRMHPNELHRFACRLQLVRYGLLQEATEFDILYESGKWSKGSTGDDEEGEVDHGVDDGVDLRKGAEDFVKKAIRAAGGKRHLLAEAKQKYEAISDERRAIVKEFLSSMHLIKKCGSCQGLSPSFRKDGFNKIFRVALTEKAANSMVQGGFKEKNQLVESTKEKKARRQQKREDRELDEGIVVDMDDVTSEEDGEDIEMLDIEAGRANGDIPDTSGSTTVMKSRTSGLSKVRQQTYISPSEVRAGLQEMFIKEQHILNLIYETRPGQKHDRLVSPDMFFIHRVLVPPNRFRPDAKTGEGRVAEAEQNSLYKGVLNAIDSMNQIKGEMQGTLTVENPRYRVRDFNDFQATWVRLQDAVNSIIDTNRNTTRISGNVLLAEGVKQKLEKKEGLFRKNMMGKRVNFAARSVISPDPNIETNEIGVPPVFARKLTYPEPVTSHNYLELKEAVMNGMERWPGAAAIENENGQVINLRTKTADERQALANSLLAPSTAVSNGARNKKVHRHLNNGDVVIMNRQPTLHKPSMMAHRARVLPGEKTLRMHYANCNTYNADFDGDEMNMHFPQNEIARAEALTIADTDHQYLVATSGKPLRGLIQDHISMSVWLTNRDTLFDRDEYQQLLYSCLRPEDNHTNTHRIESVQPAVLKPKMMWTGKQVITSILKNITPPDVDSLKKGLNLVGKSQTPAESWGSASEEATVVFQNGELLCGVLDKAHLGPTGGGFIHAVYEAYGHTTAGKLLSVLGRLLTKFLHMRAFSCGVEDLVFTKLGNKTRQEKLKSVGDIGIEVASKYVTLERQVGKDDPELRSRLEEVLRDEEKQKGLDLVTVQRNNKLSSEITAACLPSGLRRPFPFNQMQTMTTSGAKGSGVNANQISCNLGQQVLEGRRVPIMISGKSLPCFKPFETNVKAGGYVTDRFLTGVKPQAYYFHAMAGREGLIDTAVKTSKSGYLQRCLIKGMEGLKVEYDTSVRDSDGSMVQFLYGEDGLDVTKQKHLTDFRFLAENYASLLERMNFQDEYEKLVSDEAVEWQKKAMKAVRKTGRIDAKDPALALFNPGSMYGSTSEKFATLLNEYTSTNPQGLVGNKKTIPKLFFQRVLSKSTFMLIANMKAMKSVVDPGEAVGIVAGQSIGEPSTQMTLNTFHLAGHAAKNVTLGIPRLREIVMTASTNISTPTMTLELIPEIDLERGEKFAKGITKLTLAEVTSEVGVKEKIGAGIAYDQAKTFDITLDLFPRDEYQAHYAIHETDVIHTIEFRFIPLLTKEVRKELKSKGDATLLKKTEARPEIGKKAKATFAETTQEGAATAEQNDDVATKGADLPEGREGGSDDEDDDGDDDGQNNKDKQNRGAVSYEEPDEEEAAISNEFQKADADSEDSAEDEGYSSPKAVQEKEESDSEDGRDSSENEVAKQAARDLKDRIRSRFPDVTDFTFDKKTGSKCTLRLEYDASIPKILMLNHVEAAAHGAVIQSIPGIGACLLNKPKEGSSDPLTITTSGVNLLAMHDYQHILDPTKITTNDIAAMLKYYGVEACRATIIAEMDAVFKGHSIIVDNRHLNLIADFMTRGGGFSPFNRMGIKHNVSPLMKMSFETTVGFLADAALEGDWDELKGPSARIVMGKMSGVGTGCFDILTPVSGQEGI
ncbi:hypothetical protein MMC25_007700 [Agyrium rufum]|nr:hypothetical protein [Agyrium rufum]